MSDPLTILLLATVSVACALFFGLRLVRWRTMLRLHWLADVLFTSAVFLIFAGTLGGALVAAFAGLLFSVILTGGKGLDRLAKPRAGGQGKRRISAALAGPPWAETPPG